MLDRRRSKMKRFRKSRVTVTRQLSLRRSICSDGSVCISRTFESACDHPLENTQLPSYPSDYWNYQPNVHSSDRSFTQPNYQMNAKNHSKTHPPLQNDASRSKSPVRNVAYEKKTNKNQSGIDKRCLTRFFISFAAAITLLIIGTLVAALVVSQTFKTTSRTTTTTSVTTTSATTTTSTTSSSTSTTSTTSTTSSTTSTSTTSTTTTTTTSLLPNQCSSYVTNSDATRHVNYSTATVICDSSMFNTSTWVRFVSPAGTQLPTTAVAIQSCGTHATGWYNGVYPTTPGATVSGTVCYHWSGNTCNWSNGIQVTNCISYYVFCLVDPPACHARYCTI